MADAREGGFIVLKRRVRSSDLWRSLRADQRGVFVTLLLLANWKPSKGRWRDQWFEVGRGELYHSLEEIAAEANVSVKVVRTTLVALMADDRVAGGNGPVITERYPISGTGPGTGPRVLTIVNYAKYQDITDDSGTDSGTEQARVGHGSGTERAEREPVEPYEPVEPPLALAPVGAPLAEPKRATRVETDPRFAPLRAAWCEEFTAARGGAEYRWQGPADAKGIHRVIAVPIEEFRERARRGLNAIGFLRCGTVAKLTSGEVWNQLAGAGPPGPKVVTAAASNRTEFKGGRRVVE